MAKCSCSSGKFGDLLTHAAFASLLSILTIFGLLILRGKKEPDTERPYKAHLLPIYTLQFILWLR
jgi:APA family basic amino acid/polyamine antiporter